MTPVAPNSIHLPVAIVGSGITGLTCAWNLQKAGIPFVLFEGSDRVGGPIQSIREDGWLRELGPNSLLSGSSSVGSLMTELGLQSRSIQAVGAKNRFIVRHEKLVALPTSPLAFLKTDLFSLSAKLSLMAEPFRRRGGKTEDESVSDFVRRRLGREFLDYAINPFVAGVYAGDPEFLSVRHAFPKLRALELKQGSLILGAIKSRNTNAGPSGSPISFPEGLEELPKAIFSRLGQAIRLRHRVLKLERRDTCWDLTIETAGGQTVERFSSVVCALPPDALARVKCEGFDEAARIGELGQIVQPPVASVFLGFRREDVRHALNGFGFLVPSVEKRQILGSLFSSSLFPGRAPQGHVALTTFVGGTRQPQLAQLGDAELLELIAKEFRVLLGVRGDPVFARMQRYPHAIPQYSVGFDRFKIIYEMAEAAAPGLFFGGNARDGISLTHCIESGVRLAAAVSRFRNVKITQVSQPLASTKSRD